MQTATNPETGEKVAYIGGKWEKVEQTATNDKGEKAVLVSGKWVTDSGAVTPPGTTSDAPKRNLAQELGRQVGLTARAGVSGVTALPAMLGDALGLNSTGAVQGLMDRIGLPKPENGVERVAQDVAGAMAGTGGLAKVAGMAAPSGMVGQGVQNLLTQNLGTQVAASGAAAGASGTTREAGGGPTAQLVAGLAAGVGVPVAVSAAKNAVPNMVAGSVAKSDKTAFAKEGERLARETGIDLPLGARTGNKQILTLENAARQYGPTADRVQDVDVKLANQAIAKVTSLADRISAKKVDPETLGTQVQDTIKTAVSRLDTVRGKVADRDYGQVRALAGDKPVIGMTNLQKELETIIGQYENVVGADAQKIVAQAKSALEKVTGTMGSTVDEAMKTRSFYGKAARGGANIFEDVAPDMNRTLSGRLFGAVNRDFEQAGETVGGNLKNALDRANKNFANFSKSIEYVEKSALGKLVGDDLVDAAMSGAKLNTTAGEEVIKKITSMHPSTRQASIDILNRWNPQLVKDLKANVLRDALDQGMAIPPSAKGASQVPLSFNKFVNALGSEKVGFEKNLASYGFSKKEIADIKDTAVAMMRAGDKTGFNFSNTNVQKDAMEVAGALATGGAGVATGSTSLLTSAGNKALTIAGKRIGLNKIAAAMESEEGRAALRTVVSPKASPQAVIAAFATIERDQ